MARPRKRKALDAWLHGQQVGRWERSAGGEQRFRYTTAWLGHPDACPVSLSLPLRGGTAYRGALVEAWYENLVPHGGGGSIGTVQLLPDGERPDAGGGPISTPQAPQTPQGNAGLCSRVAAAFGLPQVPPLQPSCESACQALGVPLACTYEVDGGPGARRIMDLLLGSRSAGQDRLVFLKALVVSWMLCATTMHARNFILSIEPQGRFRLASIRGFASAWPTEGASATMAMAAMGQGPIRAWGDIQPRHWLSTAQACGADPVAMRGILEQLVEDTPRVVAEVEAMPTSDCPEAIADPILRGVERSTRRLAHWLTRS